MTLALIRSADRALQVLGDAPSAVPGAVIEDVSAIEPAINTAIGQVVGDGAVIISADHSSVTVTLPSGTWTSQHNAELARRTLRDQHIQALAPLYATITASGPQVQTDLNNLATIVQALANGVQPTAAQQQIIDRVLARLMIVLFYPNQQD